MTSNPTDLADEFRIAAEFSTSADAKRAGYRSVIGAPEGTPTVTVHLTGVVNPRDGGLGKRVQMIAPCGEAR